MRRFFIGLALVAACSQGSTAVADIVFDTTTLATQTLSSPLFGANPFVINAPGTQEFTVDLAAGTANVTSDFKGADLPDPLNPGGFLTYDLYNTPASTTGTVTVNGSGTYDIAFTLLFELKITSGPLAGQTFETQQFATFASSNIATLPFPVGTVFGDPARPNDVVVIYAKTALPGLYNVGDPLGTSSGRTVTINSIIPEPASMTMLGIGFVVLLGYGRHRRSQA